MQTLKLHSLLFNGFFPNYYPRSFLSLSYSVSASLPTQLSKERTSTLCYLNSNFNFSKCQSIDISKRVTFCRNPENPFSVLNFFKKVGFSQSQIQSMVRQRHQLLFANVDRTLKPKIDFFQLLGIEGSVLCEIISNTATIFSCSLGRTLVPSVEAVRKILCNDKDFVQVLIKCGAVLPRYQQFKVNVAFFESCGIVGSQLLMLLKRKPRLFVQRETFIRNLVSRAVDLGFHENSRMLVHALYTINCFSDETLSRKLELIQCFGFSKVESMHMFRNSPALLRTSEKKLKAGMEFFLHTAMVPKSALVRKSTLLNYSIEYRVVPRYRVLQLLKAENLLKKLPSFSVVVCLPEQKFLDKYISPFRETAEAAYKGHYLEL